MPWLWTKSCALVAGLTVLAFLPGSAHAAPQSVEQPPGYYVNLEGGGSFLPSATTVKGDGLNSRLTDDNGVALAGALGFRFDTGVRAEAELNYHRNRVRTIDGYSSPGHMSAGAFFLNGVYDLPPSYRPFSDRIVPYFGVGVGASSNTFKSITPLGPTSISGSIVAPALQGIVGVGYNLNDRMQAIIDYRYFHTWDSSYPTTDMRRVEAGYDAHSVMVGLRLTLYPIFHGPYVTRKIGDEAATEPQPAAEAQPASAPLPAPAARSFVVFFDFDKAELTDSGMKVVEQASVAIHQSQTTHIRVVGHTDRAGEEKYNFRLSLRRANVVKAELIRLGVTANEIDILAKGMSDPAVPTPLGVREPRNRRAEILL